MVSKGLGVFGVFLSLFYQGCFLDLQLRESIVLTMPSLPGYAIERFGVPSFLVSYIDYGGETCFFTVPAGVPSYEVLLPVKPAMPLLARPIFTGKETALLPAGALYPDGLDSRGGLSITWENGFAADLLLRLESAGFPLDKFNAARFFQETNTRGEGNPWHLDDEKIVAALKELSFRADRIKLKTTYPVSLPVPGAVWFSWNVLMPLRTTGEAGVCNFGSLPPGFHRFYLRGGDTGKLDVYVKEDGSILYTVSENW